jgi:uncharacterized Zn-finger protein
MAHVNDGTSDTGRRVVLAAAKDWTCPESETENRHYWTTCPECSERRPA